MSHDVPDVTQLPAPMTDEQIAERLQTLAPPTPIGKARFNVAMPGMERSKPAIIKENQVLRAKLINMQQLLVAMLLEREHFTDQPATFSIEELECINPRMVEMDLTETHATLAIVEVEETEPEQPVPA